MWWVVVIGVIIWALFAKLSRESGSNSSSEPPERAGGSSRGGSTGPSRSAPSHTYRPSAAGSTLVKFRPLAAEASSPGALGEINDAFTGRRLDLSQSVHECTNCHVFYQDASMVVLREANGSRCMVCGSASLRPYGARRTDSNARNHVPGQVTLESYRGHFGQVVTFTGLVHDVKQSRRGSDFAVMFENKSWTKGLKMVAFRGGVRKLGGASALKGYAGRTITIRGLLINDRTFGPEIIVDDPSMILRVS